MTPLSPSRLALVPWRRPPPRAALHEYLHRVEALRDGSVQDGLHAGLERLELRELRKQARIVARELLVVELDTAHAPYHFALPPPKRLQLVEDIARLATATAAAATAAASRRLGPREPWWRGGAAAQRRSACCARCLPCATVARA